jgi:hypothetical protein
MDRSSSIQSSTLRNESPYGAAAAAAVSSLKALLFTLLEESQFGGVRFQSAADSSVPGSVNRSVTIDRVVAVGFSDNFLGRSFTITLFTQPLDNALEDGHDDGDVWLTHWLAPGKPEKTPARDILKNSHFLKQTDKFFFYRNTAIDSSSVRTCGITPPCLPSEQCVLG